MLQPLEGSHTRAGRADVTVRIPQRLRLKLRETRRCKAQRNGRQDLRVSSLRHVWVGIVAAGAR
jgi:hypothetical protein